MDDDAENEGTDNTDTSAEDQSEGSVSTQASETTDDDAEGQQATSGDDTKADGEGGGENADASDKAEGDDQEKTEGAPEEYSDFNVPEGFDELNKELIEQAAPLFKEAGLSQEKAQDFIDLYASTQQGHVESQTKAFTEANDTNKKACEEHAEFGGDNFKGSQTFCAKAIDTLFSKEAGKDGAPSEADQFRGMLDQTGMGNHPLMFALLTKVGKSVSEDGIVDGGKAGVKADVAVDMYGKDGRGRPAET